MTSTQASKLLTDCDRCGGTGWLPSKGYRFHSANGRLCTCGRFATVTEAGNYLDAERAAESERQAAELTAARKAARLARRAADRAAEAAR